MIKNLQPIKINKLSNQIEESLSYRNNPHLQESHYWLKLTYSYYEEEGLYIFELNLSLREERNHFDVIDKIPRQFIFYNICVFLSDNLFWLSEFR